MKNCFHGILSGQGNDFIDRESGKRRLRAETVIKCAQIDQYYSKHEKGETPWVLRFL